jgi:serine protease Do
MKATTFKPFLWFIALLLLIGMACNFGASPTPEAPPPTEPPPPLVETEEVKVVEDQTGGAVSSIGDVQKAVIQIEAQGTFVNPDFTVSYNVAGYGSGFIISPTGIAVTNNHVVTGAALLKVWIGGDRTRTYNAKVLGVSECSDLAVIDIDGDDFPYLDWHSGPITVGMDVYAAGFPLGEPEFTLTKGIVSKERAAGETSWASVDSVIEHDATINPGNSGGPLLNSSGQVVGVNYRGRATNQYFAIGRDLAVRVVDNLKEGKDVDTFGVNGEAFYNDNFSGMWVYSVKPGSPADKTGLKGGDIITTLQDLVLATDGSMADYCDILRSHQPADTLSIEVLRYFTQEILQGQINGRPLEQVFSFGQSLSDEIDTGGSVDAYSGYATVTDDYGSIQMSVPVEWSDVYGGYWYDDGDVIGSSIWASADLDAFETTWSESGVFFGVSDDLAKLGGYVQLLDIKRSDYTGACKLDGRYDYEDSAFRGKYDLYTNCGNQGTALIVLTAVPIYNPQAYLILVENTITKDADLDALDMILSTFDVIGVLP